MTTITARSILASQHSWGFNLHDAPLRVDTLLLRYPRCIHAEFMTHRMFSRNSASRPRDPGQEDDRRRACLPGFIQYRKTLPGECR